MRFPTDFLWGASTSAYQTEGAWNEEGKAPSVQDMKEIPDGTTDFKVAVIITIALKKMSVYLKS